MREIVLIVAGAAILTALLLIALGAIKGARKMAMPDDVAPAVDELSAFQRMRDQGRISDEEYDRLKRIVASKTIERIKRDQEP